MSTITSIEPDPVKTDRWPETGERSGRIFVPVMAFVLFGAPGTVTPQTIQPSVVVEMGSATPRPLIAALVERGSRVRRLKDRSGLTWEQLARLVGVSRRTLHAWDVGATMSAAHRYRLEQLESRLDHLSARAESIFDRSAFGASFFEEWSREPRRPRPRDGSPLARISSSFENVTSGLGTVVASTEFDWNEL